MSFLVGDSWKWNAVNVIWLSAMLLEILFWVAVIITLVRRPHMSDEQNGKKLGSAKQDKQRYPINPIAYMQSVVYKVANNMSNKKCYGRSKEIFQERSHAETLAEEKTHVNQKRT